MEKLQNFKEVQEALKKHMPLARSQREAYTLDRIKKLLTYLDNPQNKYKVVHIAGTSGKTSTCYYVASILQAHGAKVGLTVSPHVDEVNERVQINLKPLTEKKFTSQLTKFLKLVEKSAVNPTYFELLVAFAYWQFAIEEVDYAVVEVGLGGLLDGTNVVTRADKVCVITDMGLDHTNVLGKTLAAITAQKAGIIQPYNAVFVYEQADEIMQVVREVSEGQQAELHEVIPLMARELPNELPLFQRRNWYLAWTVCKFIAERDNLDAISAEQLAQTVRVYIPARMEIIEYNGKTIIIDGAHNAQKLQVLLKSVRNRYPKQSIAIMASFVQSRKSRLHGSLDEILPLASHLIITTFVNDQDEHKVSTDPLKVVEYCEELGYTDWEIEKNPEKALAKLVKRQEPVLLIAGSFYLLNHIRPILFQNK